MTLLMNRPEIEVPDLPRPKTALPGRTTRLGQLVARMRIREGELPPYPRWRNVRLHARQLVPPGAYRGHDADDNTVYQVVESDIPDYRIVHVRGVFDPGNHALAREFTQNGRAFVLLDPAVSKIYRESIATYLHRHKIKLILLCLPDNTNNEDNKSSEVALQLATAILERRLTSSDTLLAVGGGVVCDVTGFLASTLRCGRAHSIIPTTLVAMIDAAISLKTGINLSGRFKNALGSTYPPRSVLYDPDILETCKPIPDSFRTGMAELVKLAIIRSPALFDILENHGLDLVDGGFQGPDAQELIHLVIELYLRMKWEQPYPGNKPISLRSFGHYFSKELEGLSRFLLSHGDAVAVEIAVASTLSNHREVLTESALQRVLKLLRQLDLPITCPQLDPDRIWDLVFDRRGQPFYFPVPATTLGHGTFLHSFSREEFARAVEWSKEQETGSRFTAPGQVQYWRSHHGVVRLATAHFSAGGLPRFQDQEDGEVRAQEFEPDPEERAWAQCLLARPRIRLPLYRVPEKQTATLFAPRYERY